MDTSCQAENTVSGPRQPASGAGYVTRFAGKARGRSAKEQETP